MNKLRVLYIVHHFPQISETYIRSEIEAISTECEICIISLNPADAPYRNHPPFQQTDDPALIWETIDKFRPDVLHSHWLQQTRVLAYFAGYFAKGGRRPSIPFTVRAHSFDVLDFDGKYVKESAGLVNSELCLGILAFPFTRPILEKHGIRSDKIHDCYPVVNYARFHDTSPNGDGVMNVGACLPKKRMEDFLSLASALPDKRFDLYALGYRSAQIDRLNSQMGNPVHIIAPVEPEDMLPEYKRHDWLVYTADPGLGTVGWPIAVAEAQAAGVGVCFPNLRPDLREYVGEAGFLYDSIHEVAKIISNPVPDEMRQIGFEHARKSDVFEHKNVLLRLWRRQTGSDSRDDSLPSKDAAEVLAWGEGDSELEQRHRQKQIAQDLAQAIQAGDGAVLLAGDPSQWAGITTISGRATVPYIERDGQYWGPPSDSEAAVRELERMQNAGADYVVFSQPDFWWLEHYDGLHAHLQSRYSQTVANDRVIAFDLRHQCANA